MIDTKQKLLDTAECLFGEQGYGNTSLRQVIGQAEVNIAAVHYHFGSKEDLLDAVVARKVGPITEKRLAMLAQVEAEAAGGAPEVEKVLEAFLMPTAELAESNPTFVKLMGRILSEGLMPRIVERHFQASGAKFLAAMMRAAPHVSQEEMTWRVHFMVGAMAHTLTGPPLKPLLNPGGIDFATRMRRLVRFLAAGFRAPAEGEEK